MLFMQNESLKNDAESAISPAKLQVERKKEKTNLRLKSLDEAIEVKSQIDFMSAKNSDIGESGRKSEFSSSLKKSNLIQSQKELNDNCLYITKNEYEYRLAKSGIKQCLTPKYFLVLLVSY